MIITEDHSGNFSATREMEITPQILEEIQSELDATFIDVPIISMDLIRDVILSNKYERYELYPAAEGDSYRYKYFLQEQVLDVLYDMLLDRGSTKNYDYDEQWSEGLDIKEE